MSGANLSGIPDMWRNRYAFDDFYAAQVVWDEAMAEAVTVDFSDADYIWITPPAQGRGFMENAL